MNPAVEVFRANLRNAVRTRETVSIGGGQFCPAELQALDAHLAAVDALAELTADLYMAAADLAAQLPPDRHGSYTGDLVGAINEALELVRGTA